MAGDILEATDDLRARASHLRFEARTDMAEAHRRLSEACSNLIEARHLDDAAAHIESRRAAPDQLADFCASEGCARRLHTAVRRDRADRQAFADRLLQHAQSCRDCPWHPTSAQAKRS